VIRTHGFRSLSPAALIQILKSDKLQVEEVKLWQSIIPWVLKQCHEQGLEDTAENKRQILTDILPLIRFPVMQMSDLVQSVSPTGILPQNAMLKLFTWMASRGSTEVQDDDKSDLGFNTKPRRGTLKQWSFSSTLKSQNVTLSEKNTVASNQIGAVYAFLVGDVVFAKGKHAWRTTVRTLNNSNQWLLIGIGQRKTFTDNSSYNDTTVYGVTSCNNVYRAGVATSIGGGTLSLRAGDVVDCLYDVDGQKLQYATNTGQTCTIEGVNKSYGGEVGPHYILYLNNSVKVETIPANKFGKF